MQFTIATILAVASAVVAAPGGSPYEPAPYKSSSSSAHSTSSPATSCPVLPPTTVTATVYTAASASATGTPAAVPSISSSICSQTENQSVACCSGNHPEGILGALLGDIFGGSCNINLAGEDCGETEVLACCPAANQTGLINIGSICLPITL